MTSYTIEVEGSTINLSPIGFRKWAADYFQAFKALPSEEGFSAVPFFICCRSIELAMKARHLESKSHKDVKRLYSHDLVRSYEGLDAEQRSLSSGEAALLKAANEIYVQKAFEYFNVLDAVSGYTNYPDLNQLAALAEKLCERQQA